MKIITDQRDVIRAILIFNLNATSSVMCDQTNKDWLCCYLKLWRYLPGKHLLTS